MLESVGFWKVAHIEFLVIICVRHHFRGCRKVVPNHQVIVGHTQFAKIFYHWLEHRKSACEGGAGAAGSERVHNRSRFSWSATRDARGGGRGRNSREQEKECLGVQNTRIFVVGGCVGGLGTRGHRICIQF